MTIAERIKKLRQKRNWPQATLTEKMGIHQIPLSDTCQVRDNGITL